MGDSTTIARVTCPTAPKFWRWRDLPFPKIVPREMEIHDDDHAVDEWKMQLAAAILCGVFGLAGYFLPAPFKIFFFVAAYLAGGFYPAEEVWERLQKRAIDVHFLMIAVAVGAASIGAWVEGATLLFLFSLSGALEHYALGRTQKEIRRIVPRRAQIRHRTGRPGPRKRSAGRESSRRDEAAHQARRAISRGRGNFLGCDRRR